MKQFNYDAQFVTELSKFMSRWENYQDNHAVGLGSEAEVDELSIDELAFMVAYYLDTFLYGAGKGTEEGRRSRLCEMVVDMADHCFRPYAGETEV